jgi:hypothetical protein
MPDNHSLPSELHETTRGGERVLIRPARPQDVALYPDFLQDVSAEDLRLRFWARVPEPSAAEQDKLSHLERRGSERSHKLWHRLSPACVFRRVQLPIRQ